MEDLLQDITRRVKIRELLAVAADAADQQSTEELEDAEEEVVGEPGDAQDDEMGNPYGVLQGRTMRVDEMAELLESQTERHFSTPVPVADRLGLFLSDNQRLPPGTYPTTDDGNVTVYEMHRRCPEGENPFRIHARENFHRRPAYSFVAVNAGDEEAPVLWYGQVRLLFQCRFRGELYNLAFVHFLADAPRSQYNTRKPTFTWNSPHLDCIDATNISQRVKMVKTYASTRGVRPEVYHLLH